MKLLEILEMMSISYLTIYTCLLALGSWQLFVFILGPCQSSTASWTSHRGSVDIAVTASTTSTGQVKPPHRMGLQMAQTCTRRSTRRRKMTMTKRGRRKRKRRKRRSKNIALNTLASPAVIPVELVCEEGTGVLFVKTTLYCMAQSLLDCLYLSGIYSFFFCCLLFFHPAQSWQYFPTSHKPVNGC